MLYDGICRDVLSEIFHVRRPLFSKLIFSEMRAQLKSKWVSPSQSGRKDVIDGSTSHSILSNGMQLRTARMGLVLGVFP
jgi:hypothetical protein